MDDYLNGGNEDEFPEEEFREELKNKMEESTVPDLFLQLLQKRLKEEKEKVRMWRHAENACKIWISPFDGGTVNFLN